jgi:hypothetical protein
MNTLTCGRAALRAGALRTAWAIVLPTSIAVLLGACAQAGDDGPGGYGGGYNGDGYYMGYYEPYGYEYGGWGGAYRVGPGRRGERGGRDHVTHAYRAAPAAHRAPSIPSQSHRR